MQQTFCKCQLPLFLLSPPFLNRYPQSKPKFLKSFLRRLAVEFPYESRDAFPTEHLPRIGLIYKTKELNPSQWEIGVVLGITFRLSQPIPPFHPLSALSFLSLLWLVYSPCTFPLSPHCMNCRCLGSHIAKHTLASRCHPFASVCRLGAEAASCA